MEGHVSVAGVVTLPQMWVSEGISWCGVRLQFGRVRMARPHVFGLQVLDLVIHRESLLAGHRYPSSSVGRLDGFEKLELVFFLA